MAINPQKFQTIAGSNNFNIYPLVWHFNSAVFNGKIEKIQERSLRVLFNDFEYRYIYHELLEKANKVFKTLNRLKNLEVFKTLNSLNPSYMKKLFTINVFSNRRKNDLATKRTVRYVDKSLRSMILHGTLFQNM